MCATSGGQLGLRAGDVLVAVRGRRDAPRRAPRRGGRGRQARLQVGRPAPSCRRGSCRGSPASARPRRTSSCSATGTVATISGDPAGATPTGTHASVPVQGLDNIADRRDRPWRNFYSGGPWALALRGRRHRLVLGRQRRRKTSETARRPRNYRRRRSRRCRRSMRSRSASFALALDDQGEVWTWGFECAVSGQPGQPRLMDLTPRKVAGPSGSTSIRRRRASRSPTRSRRIGTAWNWGFTIRGTDGRRVRHGLRVLQGPGVVRGSGR